MFVRSYNPIWYFTDLIGLPLNDNYWVFFLANTLPYIPQNVYQDPNGISAWENPIEVQPSDTLPNNLYFDPSLVYRIEVREGPGQTSPLIWLIENYVPGTGGGSMTQGTFANSINLVTNPQFADIDFVSPLTFTQASPATYTIDVGPGWQLVLVGAGTTVLAQITIPGDTWPTSVAGNAPFALQVNNTGWTSATLVQTFTNNGEIFANGAISMSVAAVSITSPQNINLTYHPSGTSNDTPVVSNMSVPTGAYTIIGNTVKVPASENALTGLAATVQMLIGLPASGTMSVTNVQFIGQASNLLPSPPPVPTFQEISYERVVDQEFHLYKQSLLNEPKNSILTGWNFGNNPWQFTPTASANVATNAYTADQTIVIQQNYVASATGNNVAVGQDSVVNNYGLKVTAVTAANQFGILQYIAPQTIRQYWGNTLSSMVKAFITTTHSTSLGIKMRLIYKAGLPGTVAQADPIATWTANGDPVAASGYTLIAPTNDPVYILTSTPTYYSFNGFVLTASSNANMTLGILLYTNGSMSSSATADSMTINDVSLVNNDFALPTQPETFDETLRKCQFYYEKSYDVGTLPGTASISASELEYQQHAGVIGGGTVFRPNGFSINYKSPKSIPPNAVNIYSPSTGTVNYVTAIVYANTYNTTSTGDYAISNYAANAAGLNGLAYIVNAGAASGPTAGSNVAPPVGSIILHYTVNACLGNPTLL